MASERPTDGDGSEAEFTRDIWRTFLTGEGDNTEGMRRVVRAALGHLPSDPRCKICRAPFRGFGHMLVRPFGFSAKAWQMNPKLCNRCETFVRKHEVGVELDVTMLFADVRGSTAMAERLGPAGFHQVIDRFYRAATRVLIDSDALIEKLIGDEVAGLYVPGIAGPDYERRAVAASQELLATRYGEGREPWVEIRCRRAQRTSLRRRGRLGFEHERHYGAWRSRQHGRAPRLSGRCRRDPA